MINFLILLFGILFVIGLIFLVRDIYLVGILPLFVLALGISISPPKDIEIEKTISKNTVMVGDIVELKTKIKIKRGIGLVLVKDRLPEDFILVEGKNVTAFFKGLGKLEKEFSYKVRCANIGTYKIEKSKILSNHFLNINGFVDDLGNELKIRVMPYVTIPRRLNPSKIYSKIPLPSIDISKGVSSTDFKEIREYREGEPVKFINWKASAKANKLLANEYEKEGKKTIMIFVDVGSKMFIGNIFENPFKYAMSLLVSLSSYFTKKNYNVGVYFIGIDKLILPSTGKKQFIRIVDEVLAISRHGYGKNYDNDSGIVNPLIDYIVESDDKHNENKKDNKNPVNKDIKPNGFYKSLKSNENIILQNSPLIIYITNLYEKDIDDIREGLTFIYKIYNKRKKMPIIIFDINFYGAFDKNTSKLINLMKRSIHKEFRKYGITTILWNTESEDINNIMRIIIEMIR
ncbi:protein of unknown function DUF58 [Methanocaldococcus vulcanius M7]|uniref:DUF58 domain-containing protein n=1 Tax=Methanocaldococcus vulcanius (strain ATCC 700851 / DSM 12094 / M7) TaxID=579137 RepID=C9RHY5_METVM|nr:DUF58 domain-containing protein [Methanocaldococcus vulcanius]ACX73187.1 protein of unknown function DUF58 [Methanocaldococcus vulcanius M7]